MGVLECTNISLYAAAIRRAATGLAPGDARCACAGLPELLDPGVFGLVTIGFRKPVLPACSGRMSVPGLPDGRP